MQRERERGGVDLASSAFLWRNKIVGNQTSSLASTSEGGVGLEMILRWFDTKQTHHVLITIIENGPSSRATCITSDGFLWVRLQLVAEGAGVW